MRARLRAGAAHPRLTLLLSPITFLLIWTLGLLTGLRLDFARDWMIQFVGAEELASVSYAEAWRSIHMQPPGFNMLLKFSDSLGGGAELFWLILLLAGTLAALWMVGDLVWTLTGDLRWSLGAGMLAAVIPGTLYYSLWVFYTSFAAVMLATMVWGMTVGLVRRSAGALLASMLAVLALFLLRSTYVWVLVIAWIVVVGVLGWRRLGSGPGRGRGLLVLASTAGILVVLGIQGLTWSTYGVLTQSSWGYESGSKALMTQLSPAERLSAARGDECLEQVVSVGVFAPIDAYPACGREAVALDGVPSNSLLGSRLWVNGFENLNTADRLALSDQWRSFAVNVITDNPLTVLRIPFPNLETKERGTIVRFLWPSSWYWLIDTNVSAGGVVASAWIVLFSWVPVAGLLGIILGMFAAPRRWPRGDARRTAYMTGSWVVLGTSVAYLFLETGENERFRVEIDWLIIALGAVGWMAWLRRGKPPVAGQQESVDRSAARS